MKLGESNLKKVMVLLCVCALSLLLTASDCGYRSDPGGNGYHLPRWSQDGKSIVFTFKNTLYLAATDGSRLEIVARGGGDFDADSSPDISPDGTRIVYAHFDTPAHWNIFASRPHWEIKTADIDGSSKKTLAKHKAGNINPAWSPDGTRIAFVSGRNFEDGGSGNLFTMSPDGSNVELVTPLVNAEINPPAWSPDGGRLAFVSRLDETKTNYAYVVGVDGSGLTKIGPSETRPTWSPDGRILAFIGLKERAWAMYTARADGSELTKVMDIDDPPSYNEPHQSLEWSPDGTQLLRSGGGTKVSVVNVDGSDLRSWPHIGVVYATWSPDGTRVAYLSWEPLRGRLEKPDKSAVRIVLATANPDWSDTRALVIEREGKLHRAAQSK